ncbi:MAG: hypothetical protein K2K45_10195 [Muribaculaceae bacterium]|nr:hypothetical protein [Muribaculaceae bacterium]
MKKILLSLLLGAAAVGGVQASTFNFSYVNGVTNYIGMQAAETYDVAVFFPGEIFEGYRIKKMSANVNANYGVDGYKSPSMWLSGSLDLDGNMFTPGIASYDVSIESDGNFSTTLSEDYVIPAEGVYAGYTVTVATLNNGTAYPIGMDNCVSSDAFFCRTDKTLPEWENIASQMDCGCAMTFVLENDDVSPNSVTISSIPNPLYMEIGKTASINLGLASFSSEPVTSVDVDYNIEGQSGSCHFDLLKAVPAGLNKEFEVTLELPAIDHKFAGNYSFTVSKVNGMPNDSKKNTKEIYVASFSNVPVHQTLIEEYTGTWCQWCTGGYAMLEYIKKNEPDFVVAAYHDNDAMQVTSVYPSTPKGYPCVYLDRYYCVDPLSGTNRYTGIAPLVQDVRALNSQVTPWGIEVSHEWDGDTLVANAKVWNVLGVENGDYRIAYILVADGLSGTTSSWVQSNGYYNILPNANYVDELKQFCRGGKYGKSYVAGLVFNDVVVSTTGIYGVQGSIPANLEEEEIVAHSISFDISSIKSSLIPDRNKLRVIAAVVDGNGFVVNCVKNEVNDYGSSAGVEGINAFDSELPVEYYNLSGVKVDNPANGIFIRRQGSKTEKVFLKD